MKILTILGARPQFIKASPVSAALSKKGGNETLVHTGQHYDENMSNVFFEELNIPKPHYNLGIAGGSHGEMTGKMLAKLETVMMTEKPTAVLVYGDTNSTLAGALAASKLHIPLIHIEAGLRSRNRKMPEEINRVLTDHISDLLLCPSQQAVDNLNKEGITNGVYEAGDVMADVCHHVAQQLPDHPEILKRLNLEPGQFYLATCHRAENTSSTKRILPIIEILGSLDKTVVFPIHPRTKSVISKYDLALPPNVFTIPPVGYAEMIALIKSSRAVLTDSGGLQKEAYWLRTPCLTMRDETEWTETVTSGWNHLVGTSRNKIHEILSNNSLEPAEHFSLYGDGHSASRCAEIICSYFKN